MPGGENLFVTAHGVGAFGQKPIPAKNMRGERTLPKIGKGEAVLFVVFSRSGQIRAAARKHHLRGTHRALCEPVIIVSLGH